MTHDSRSLLAGVTIFVLGMIIGFFVAPVRPETVSLVHRPSSMSECYGNAMKRAGIERADIPLQNEIRLFCAFEILDQGRLNDFQLRRMAYFQQDYAAYITLWMVVVITISGVVLAGVQLLASYNLSVRSRDMSAVQAVAAAGATPAAAQGAAPAMVQFVDSGQLEVEKGRLVLRSSVTGLFILIVSFGFFLVYVLEIYTLKENDPDRRAAAQQGVPVLQPGGIGHVNAPASPGGSTQQPPSP